MSSDMLASFLEDEIIMPAEVSAIVGKRLTYATPPELDLISDGVLNYKPTKVADEHQGAARPGRAMNDQKALYSPDWDLRSVPLELLRREITEREALRKEKGLYRGGKTPSTDRCPCGVWTKVYAAGRRHRCGACACGWSGSVSRFAREGAIPQCPKCGSPTQWTAINNHQPVGEPV